MYCRIEQIDETSTFIKDHVKKSIKSHCPVLSILCKTKEKNYLKPLSLSCNYSILIYCINSLTIAINVLYIDRVEDNTYSLK